ncbi:hypothetical protein AXL65_02350 [Salmonella enterica subsp. enterica]|nr:hypothetical protein [Salmonella enterica subsp. enterica]
MFQLKNFVSIAASMLNYVRSTTGKVTDLQPGSVTRTILEAPAAEIEELYVQVFNGIKEAIPVAVYQSINFPKLPAQYASGQVTVIANAIPTQDLTVFKGTEFLARDGRIYKTVADQTWPMVDGAGKPNMSWTFPVISALPGVLQNASAGEINASPTFALGDYTFSNTDIINGADIESDAARDTRFADYIASLSRGTETALIYGARSANIKDAAGNIIEAVSRVSLTISSGTVRVNVWGTNGTPSPALIQRVTDIELGYRDANGDVIPGYAAAGIRCQIAAMNTRAVDVKYTLEMLPGFMMTAQVIQAVKDSLNSYLGSVQPNDVVYIDDIANVALLVRGVKASSVNITQNLISGSDEVLVGGIVDIVQKLTTRIIDIRFTVTLAPGATLTQVLVDDITKSFKTFLDSIPLNSTVTGSELVRIPKLYPEIADATVDLTNGITRGTGEQLLAGNVSVVIK